MDGLSEFFDWIMTRTIGKLFFLVLLAAPILALFALLGIFPKKKSESKNRES